MTVRLVKMKKSHRLTCCHSGFTLIELSIVLVIIGLIVGGILVGRDMVRSAEIRADVGEAEKINSAINAFKLKYNCLPGDCANATALFGIGPYGHINNGDGNGLIRGYMNSSYTSETTPDTDGHYVNVSDLGSGRWIEWFSVFDHLAAAGLYNIAQYDEGAISSPNVAANVAGGAFPAMHWQHGNSDGGGVATHLGGITVGYELDAHYLRYGTCYYNLVTVQTSFVCGYSGSAAAQFDAKIDDGKPFSGSVQATDPIYILRVSPAGGPFTNCVNGTDYVAANDGYRAWGCGLRVKAAF
jgi:prepilin-type N-terminal cleavage/methylation domain-containing protein